MRRALERVDSLARLLGRSRAVPPRRLRARVGAPGAAEFVAGGRDAAHELNRALGCAERELDEFESVLDLGCGSARVLPHVAALAPRAVCTGCDVDAEAIAWAARNHPDLRFSVSEFEPPLPFPEASFDLVYSISVLSHLGDRLADAWLREVRRVLRADGIALLTVHGAHAFEQFRTGRVRTTWIPRRAFERGPLEPGEFVFQPYERSVWNRAELPGVRGTYGLAFHGQQFLRTRWCGALEVICVAERGIAAWQDVVVCRKSPWGGRS